ncbi:MAG: hypothetical protein OCD01_11220 [Fibrobacterales bacterium]
MKSALIGSLGLFNSFDVISVMSSCISGTLHRTTGIALACPLLRGIGYKIKDSLLTNAFTYGASFSSLGKWLSKTTHYTIL